MRIDLYGLTFETPGVSFYLWSAWRAAALEVKLFEAVARISGMHVVKGSDELRIDVDDPKLWRSALQTVARVMKGWQEEADPGNEKRGWRWLLEADTDLDGYDHNGERASLWGFLRVGLDRGSPAEGEKGEDFDLDNFGFRISGVGESTSLR
jgi:hypothetical protein